MEWEWKGNGRKDHERMGSAEGDEGDRSGKAARAFVHLYWPLACTHYSFAHLVRLSLSLTHTQECYERALEIFELVEDVDKAVKVLMNLANMAEGQVRGGGTKGWGKEEEVEDWHGKLRHHILPFCLPPHL